MNDLEGKYIKIVTFGPIEKSRNGNEYRHVTLKDINNKKTVNYVIFKTQHRLPWYNILNNKLDEALYFGEIIEIEITKELLDKLESLHRDKFRDGDIITLLINHSTNNPPEVSDDIIIKSIKEQFWRFKFLPRGYLQNINDLSEYPQDEGDSTDWKRDYFIAMTDGLLGDYEDFHGDIDDIQTWSRG